MEDVKIQFDKAMVDELRNGIFKVFVQNALIRNLFVRFFKKYTLENNRVANDKNSLWISTTGDRDACIKSKKGIYHANWDNVHGNALACGDSSRLVGLISKQCDKFPLGDFQIDLDASLRKIENPEDRVILAVKVTFWKIAQDIVGFNFIKSTLSDKKPIDIRGFEGWYKFDGDSVPVFRIDQSPADQNSFERQVLVLNKSKVGRLVQLSPLGDDRKREFLMKDSKMGDMLYMRFRDLSAEDEKELMESTIKDSTDLPGNVGNDQEKRREYLQECVLIEIREGFEFEADESNFQGYKLIYTGD